MINAIPLQVDGDVAEVEKQQQKVVDDLRDQLQTAEHKLINKSEKSLREAEKYTAQATSLQSKLSAQIVSQRLVPVCQHFLVQRERHGKRCDMSKESVEEAVKCPALTASLHLKLSEKTADHILHPVSQHWCFLIDDTGRACL